MTVPDDLDTDTLVVVSEIADQLIQTYQVCQKSSNMWTGYSWDKPVTISCSSNIAWIGVVER